MSAVDTLYRRNAQFAEHFTYGDLPLGTRLSTIVLTCADARVDPAFYFGLEPGEAVVLRNAGGRVTEDVTHDLAFFWSLVAQMAGDAAPELSLAIVHHQNCAMERLADSETRRGVNRTTGIPEEALERRCIADHERALHDDVARLRASSLLPDELSVSAHLYDPATGRVREIAAAAPLRP